MAQLYWPQIESATASVQHTVSQNAPYIAPNVQNKPVSKVAARTTSSKTRTGSAVLPDVLKGSRWIYSYAGPGACNSSADAQWSFSRSVKQAGYQCSKISNYKGEAVYSCRETGAIRKRDYHIQTGNAYIGEVDMVRPNITLTRVDRPSKKIGLKMCLPGDLSSNYSRNDSQNRKSRG